MNYLSLLYKVLIFSICVLQTIKRWISQTINRLWLISVNLVYGSEDAYTKSQIESLRKLPSHIVLVFDSEEITRSQTFGDVLTKLLKYSNMCSSLKQVTLYDKEGRIEALHSKEIHSKIQSNHNDVPKNIVVSKGSDELQYLYDQRMNHIGCKAKNIQLENRLIEQEAPLLIIFSGNTRTLLHTPIWHLKSGEIYFDDLSTFNSFSFFKVFQQYSNSVQREGK